VKAAQSNMRTPAPILVSDAIGAVCRGDVDLDHDQVRPVIQLKRLDMFVLDFSLIAIVQVPGERREAKRREQRVLNRAPQRARRLHQSGQDEFDLHWRSSTPARMGCAAARSLQREVTVP
jgi:hypothetical protein